MMCCYHPTTVVVIDDDVDFLNIMNQHSGITDCKSYSSPREAIDSLSKQNPFLRIQSRVLKSANRQDDTLPEDLSLLFSMRGLHEEIYNMDRFNDVSVLIVDYYMDDINGIDVCEALANHPAKKILLTGGADKEKVAIEAFNKGIIHRFISKSDPNFLSKLKQAITLLKESYFRDLSASFFPHNSTLPINLYQNPTYVNFTRNILEQFDAVEYYMVDTTGSCLMLDTNGNPSWFILKHETDMKVFEKLARDQEAPKHFIQGISERLLMPFFLSDEDYQQPTSEWKRFFYAAQSLHGVKDYYYSIVEGCRDNHICVDMIAPYSIHCDTSKV